MHTALVTLALLVLVSAAPIDHSFEKFKRTHRKFYISPQEEQRRFEIFEANAQVVAALNAQNGDAEFSLNTPFADMTAEEFRHKMLMSSPPKFEGFPEEKFAPLSASNDPLPESFSWLEKKGVPVLSSPRDQGSVGTCFVFSAVETVESRMALKYNKFQELSTEQVAECDNHDCGVFGGWPYSVFNYIQEAKGLLTENELSYCVGLKESCFPCMPAGYNITLCGDHKDLYCNHTRDVCRDVVPKSPKAAVVTGWAAISNNETEIARQLVELGPLSVALNAQTLQFYHKGIVDPMDFLCSRDELNHAVLLIGYGQEKNKDYWIVRNSWGNWGENGNFRIVRGKDKCGIARQVTTVYVA